MTKTSATVLLTLSLVIITAIALGLAGCAPDTIQLGPIVNPDWP